MRKFNLFMLFMVFFAINGFSQTNIAPLATVTADGTGGGGCRTGACSTLNDLNFGTCGTQQMWISTSGPPSTTIGDDWIEWNFPSVRTFDSLIIHHGYNNRRTISGATVQYWDGTAWVTHSSFTNLTQQCINRIGIGKLASDRFRITRFEMANAGQNSNPSFREIEVIEAPSGANDAAALALDSPSVFCSGAQNIVARIGNLGVNQIDSVDVHWEVGGVAQPSLQYIGLLDTITGSNPYWTQVTLGSYNFPSGLTEVKFWVSNPNGVTDTINQNDTLVAFVGPALNGTYTVDASNPTGGTNFNSIADMNYALNTFGVCGPTTINVVNGTYNEAIYLDNVPGLSATNHLIIDGGDSSQTILSQGTQFATLTFNGSPNVHVKNFTLEQVGASGDAVIFSNGSQYDTLSSCVTRVDVNSTSSGYYNISFSPSTTSNSSGVSADYNVVQNNRIIGGYYAIRIYGASNNLNTYNQFINNEIDSAYYYGIYSYYQDSIEVVGNSINMLSRGNTNADGGYMYYSNNTKFSKNYVWAGDYGVRFYNSSVYAPVDRKFEVSNNMIYSSGDYGVYMYEVDSVNFWHNSINVEGTTPALYITSDPIGDYDVRNNIFSTLSSEAIQLNEPDTIFSKFNNNNYYTATGINLLDIDGVAYANLAAYQTAAPTYNTQSLEGDPQFVSNTNLHIVGAFVNDSGDATVGILEDIDGDVRPMVGASSVDIGADEYNPPTCPPPHSLMTYNPTTDSVTIAWSGNFSGTTFEYELVECGNAQGTGTVSAITSLDSLRVGNLNASTCYELYVREICGRGDSSMWVNAFPFYTLCTKDSIPFVDDFSGGVISPCWTISDPTYVTIESSCLGRSNVIDINYEEEAITPPIKAAAAQSIEIGYYIGAGACINDPEDYEHFYVEYWDGTQWVLLRDYDGSMPNAFVWETFILPPGSYDDSLMVKFDMIDGTTDAWQIDSVVIKEGPSCLPPLDIAFHHPSVNSIDIAWNSYNTGSTYEYELVECGDPQGTGTVVGNTTLDSIQVGGLDPSTCYELFIRELCSGSDSSDWVSGGVFYTLCAKDTIPFVDDFSGGVISPCWTISSTTDVTIEASCLGRSNVIDINYEEEAVTPPIKAAAAQSIEIGYYIGAGACINDPEDYEHFYVEYWNGTQWVLLKDYDGTMPNAFVWESFIITQGSYDDSLMVRFNMIDGTTDAWQIDSVVVQEGPALNAVITELISPSSICPGSVTPVLGVLNGGSSTLDSLTVYWDVNGVLDSLTYRGTINSGDTAAISLAALNFSASQLYNLMFYTAKPNGMADERPANDTLELNGLRTGMSGTITLDPSQAASATNYTSFDALTQDLNAYGVCGPTTINVANGTYSEDIYLSSIPGASASNNIVIDGGDSSLTIVSQGTEYATLVFDSTQYVKVTNMTIENTSTSSVAVNFSNGSRYDTLSNSVTKVDVTSASSSVRNIVFSASTTSMTTGADVNYNVIQNNRVIGGYYGFYLYGSSANLNTYNQVLNNEVDSVYYYGMYTYYQDSLEVVGNSINMLSRGNTNADGGYMYYSNNTKFSKNYIWAGDYGVRFYNYSTYAPINRQFEVSNNMIYSENDYGVYMYSVDSVDFWHNTIHVEGTTPALYITASTVSPISNYDVRNNIFSSLNSEAVQTFEPDTIFVKMNNNLYETDGPVLLNIDGTPYASLAGYQSVQPLFNTLSLEGNPQFVSNTDLHILGSFVNDNGDGSIGIVEDIDGDVRPLPGASNVDIGADEFDPPSCPRPLSFNFYKSSIDSVTVAWNGNSSAGEYEIEVLDCGDPQGTGTMSTIFGDSITIGGLTPNVCYEIYVREICARGDTSFWSDVFQFGLKDSCESFDNYSLGSVSAQSILIDGWDNNEGDAEVSNDYASSGSNSLKIHDSGVNGFSDVVANLDTYTSGKWNISIDFLIPQGNGGYYNILHNYLGGGGSVWAIETYLDSSGVATVNEGTNGAGVIGTYNFTPGSWNSISHIIDLDNDTAYLKINGVPTGVGWQFSLGAANGNQFNAFNFFSAANAGQTPLMYFDNFCIKAFEEASIDGAITDLVAPIDNGLQCYSSTEAVSVELVNAGLDSLDFTVDTADVTMVISGMVSQTLNFTVDDNTLNGGLPIARGESINVPLGTFDMSAVGTYYFDAVVDIRADSVQVNNAYSDSITTQAFDGGSLTSNSDTLCAGDTTMLSVSGYYGGIQWQEFDGTSWVNLGSTSEEVEVYPMNTTEYRVLVCGTASSDTVEVFVNSLPAPAATGDTAIVPCGSEGVASIELMPTQPGSYFVWYDSAQAGNEISTAGKYYVSTIGDTLTYTDSATSSTTSSYDTVWVEEVIGSGSSSSLLITEFDPGAPDMLEIQNVSNSSVDVTGWSVAISDDYNNINDVNTIVQTLSGTWTPGQTQYWNDQAGVNDWGNNIYWSQSNNAGWILLIDDVGNIVDYVAWEWTAADIQTMSVNVNGFTITPGTSGAWVGNGIDVGVYTTGNSFSRVGSTDNNDSSDFTLQTLSAGVTNTNLLLPFASTCRGPRSMVIVGVDCLVGLDNNNTEVAGNIEVYPNPSNGLFTLNITTEQEENFVLSVRDVQGKLIYEENLRVKGAHRDEIDLEGLAKGVYYLQIQNDQASKVEKLIIQ